MNTNFKMRQSFEVKAQYGRGPVYAGQITSSVKVSRPYGVVSAKEPSFMKVK